MSENDEKDKKNKKNKKNEYIAKAMETTEDEDPLQWEKMLKALGWEEILDEDE